MSEEVSAASPSTVTPVTGLALPWAIGLGVTIFWPTVGLWILPVIIIGLILLLWRFFRSLGPAWLRPTIILFFTLTSSAALFVAGSLWSQVCVAFISIGLLAWYLDVSNQNDEASNSRVVNLVLAMGVFFSWLVLLSIADGLYIVLPWWWLVTAAGLITSAVAILQWRAAGIPFTMFRSILPLTALLAAQLFIAIWWLPTVVTVGSTIAATAIILWFQVCRHIWHNSWEAGRGRRYLIVGLSLIILLLVSARWH